jgi:hypothetical protein
MTFLGEVDAGATSPPAPFVPDGCLSSAEAAEYAGTSQRNLNDICSKFPGLPASGNRPGTGVHRRWTPIEAQRLAVIALCRRLGCSLDDQRAVYRALELFPTAKVLVMSPTGGCRVFAPGPIVLEAGFTGWVLTVPDLPRAA